MYVDTRTNQVFSLVDGRAVFACHVGEIPKTYRAATVDEVKTYQAARAAAWRLVLEHKALCYVVLKRMKYRGDYEDLVHDVGLPTLLRCAELWDGARPFAGYAAIALRNKYLTYLLKQRAVATLNEDYSERVEQSAGDVVYPLLRKLCEIDRCVLLLRFWRDATVREIAEHFEVSTGTAHSLLKRALRNARLAYD